jgi:hypothetical protein
MSGGIATLPYAVSAPYAGVAALPLRLNEGGLVAPGTIDLAARTRLQNPDGTFSTVESISIGTDQGEVLIPTISPDGQRLSEEEAIQLYEATGQHLGIFRTPAEADAFARQLSSGLGS